ncbi:formate C-acetyltransferase/glycerol dehydratase family glycyl radical enzyme [Morganella morganii]|uniref:Formate C-acetyltransferase/glycerol dehydratase family glycyl radical enzyme n=1 Tax=Morganella morganii TaxID=582 RepID=A0A8I0UAK4_MORMO|nr:pyruvate formate lyase family protein [Morganella morganii]MBE8614728.1 formate C-acetyltransferase/glycerol dehydratase family glycyl radical enzyme [Morganella morganii]
MLKKTEKLFNSIKLSPLSERIESARQNYVNSKPQISYERARIWTESHKKTEGLPVEIRRAMAFKDCCEQLDTCIFDGELIVGSIGEFRKCGILTPEFSWRWVDNEMDNFSVRQQDPYIISDLQKDYIRSNIFPYWKNKSLEESFLAQLPEEIAKVTVDTGIVDNDSKWRQSVGEVTPDYSGILFKKGFSGIIDDAKEKLSQLSELVSSDADKINFYKSIILTSEGIIILANRYAEKALQMSKNEENKDRKNELLEIARICKVIPAEPPKTFWEAAQFVWFVQLGGILSENPLALNPGRFDQYMYPYYLYSINVEQVDNSSIQEIIHCLWLKFSEWVWTISANTADFFAGYNQFQNLTVGGRKSDGSDATNELSYMCLNATANMKTHQPGLSVRIHQNSPQEFVDAVTELTSLGTGFPAIHCDEIGYQMVVNNGISPSDAYDWNNCGCVVPHHRKVGEWTSAVNLNIAAAVEFSLHSGMHKKTNQRMGLDEVSAAEFTSYEQVEKAFFKQFDNLMDLSVYNTLLAQKLHKEMVPRPFLSSCNEGCLESGIDLAKGGATYNVGPVITGVGLAVSANSLAVIKELVFDKKECSLEELLNAMDNNWENYKELRQRVLAVPKYGNGIEFVDDIAMRIANHFYNYIRNYKDINGKPFLSAFMGISNYLPTGKVLSATPDGRFAWSPISEGVSPYAGSDKSTILDTMNSIAKMNQQLHSGGTLLNLRLGSELVKNKRGRAILGDLIKTFFSLGAFHVQFNTLSTDILLDAQNNPENYKDLLVRVAGYSTQFVNLSKSMQDAIIARSIHDQF